MLVTPGAESLAVIIEDVDPTRIGDRLAVHRSAFAAAPSPPSDGVP